MYDCLTRIHRMSFFIATKTLLLLVFSIFYIADGKIIESTTNSEVVIGEPIELVCVSSIQNHVHWKHIPLGATEWNSVNTNGKLTPDFAARFQLNGNNLVIRVVQQADAGKYICIEDMGEGERSIFEITVLESFPQCSSNINREGMVTENDIGIQPEDIFLSCSLTFHGNIAPELEWKASNESYKTNISNKPEKKGNKIMINAVTQAILKQDGVQYVCQTKLSKEKYPCYSAMVKSLYLFNSPVETLTLNEPRLILCSANTGQTCKYTWTANEGNIVVSEQKYLNLFALQNKSGIVEYTCTAECELRNKIFTVMPMIVKFELLGKQLLPHDWGCSLSTFYGSFVTFLVLIIVAVIAAISYKFYPSIVKKCRLSTKKRRENEASQRLLEVLNEDQEDNIMLLKDCIEETAIQGLAIIKKKLFVCVKNSNTIIVFEANNPYNKLKDEIYVKGLENPVDMTSVKDSDTQKHCLYITDSENSLGKRRNVWKIEFVSLLDKIETKAPTCYTVGNGWPHTISAADDGRLLITKEGRPPKLFIHGINYGKIENINLPSEVKLPRHALSTGKNFIISHSDGICKIDRSGKVLQRFDLLPHNLLVSLNDYLTHMTTDGQRIYVADYSNHRVVCFDPESQEKVVLFHKFGEDEWPTRVLYNKLNNHLLIGMESGKVYIRSTNPAV